KRVTEHYGAQDNVQVTGRMRPQEIQEGRVGGCPVLQLDQHVEEDHPVERADHAAGLSQLEGEVPPVTEPPTAAAPRGILVDRHRLTATPTPASGASACAASSRGT